jgi:Family of unknown function (DUF6011)
MKNENNQHEHEHDFRGQLTSVADALRFMQAGKATITLVSKKTSARFTYKLGMSDDKKNIFVGLLCGSDNTSDYKYLGRIALDRGSRFWAGRKQPRPGDISKSAPSVLAFEFVWNKLQAGSLGEQVVEIWHEGSCGRCGRKLTVPSSVKRGFGPECASILGIELEESLPAADIEIEQAIEDSIETATGPKSPAARELNDRELDVANYDFAADDAAYDAAHRH